jgi:hypothetical protein
MGRGKVQQQLAYTGHLLLKGIHPHPQQGEWEREGTPY